MHTFRLILLALFVLLGSTAPLNTLQAAPHPAQSGSIASLDPVEGIVQHQPADADPHDPDAWDVLTGPVVVAAGDRVRTNRDGLAVLTFFEGVASEIGPNTLIVISTLDLSALDEENFNISLDVLLGVTLTTIDATLDAGDRFEIHTPGATAVVRGTTWWTLVHQDGSAEFESVEGEFGILSERPAAAALEAAPDGTAEDRAFTAETLWETWEPFDPGITGYFAPDGARLEPPPTIRLPGRTSSGVAVSPTCGDDICQPLELNTCPVDCQAQIDLSLCGNGICEPEANEDLLLCPGDCGPYAGASCGNDVCDADESNLTCPVDCAAGDYFSPVFPELCGNGTCDPTESTLSCAADCRSSDVIPAGSCTITGSGINLRSGPGTDSDTVGQLLEGETLSGTAISADGRWYRVENARGQSAWVAGWLVRTEGPCERLPVVGP